MHILCLFKALLQVLKQHQVKRKQISENSLPIALGSGGLTVMSTSDVDDKVSWHSFRNECWSWEGRQTGGLADVAFSTNDEREPET